MAIYKRVIRCILLLLCLNLTLILFQAPPWLAIPAAVALLIGYVLYNVKPLKTSTAEFRLGMLNAGYELALMGMICLYVEIPFYLTLTLGGLETRLHVLIINAVVCWALLLVMISNGIIRIFVCTKQLGILSRIFLLSFWWVPVVNLLLLRKIFANSRTEYRSALQKHELNDKRRQQELCKTRYPLLLVHGIFYRDWEQFNYWGRIPEELLWNGATIYYGNQKSTASVAECGEELRQTIERIVWETDCEKVNIIAHSKGGLDSRYAISVLGMGSHVASLTTVNTPHWGCNYVKKLLEVIPQKAVEAIGSRYEELFERLGDVEPDFFSGLQNLTDTECARLNELMPDVPGVLYQSVGSRMRSRRSAFFPLGLGYNLIRLSGGGDNDGFVATESMKWGNFLGIVSPTGRRGVSHVDVVDLTRRDLPGFDVREFYVDLVHRLKLQGL